jgi:predicted nucleic acid-binding protein
VRIIADTNVILRLAVQDDPLQEQTAGAALRDCELIAVTVPTLCEFAWVLARRYKKRPAEIAAAIRLLLGVEGVEADWPAVDAGLAVLDDGGDFADGVIAFEGARLGGEIFVTFDRDATSLLKLAGRAVRLLPASE